MNLFDTLLEIKTGKKGLVKKAVYLKNAIPGSDGYYYIYYYDLVNHTFYLNDIDGVCKEQRPSVVNVLERLVSKAYVQELDSYGSIVKKILQKKKPKVIYFYRDKNRKNISIARVKLKVVLNRKSEIIRFKDPVWEKKSLHTLSMKALQ